MDRIYTDNAATTRVSEEVLEAMLPYLTEKYGNPNSLHSAGREVRIAVDRAREQVAAAIGCEPSEIYFTAGGSESDNWAIKGAARRYGKKGRHIITSKIEHHAVLHSLAALEKDGFEVTYLDVDEKGFISLEELEKAIRPDTILITVMFANNEIGSIQPIAGIAEIARAHNILFHTDAVQAVGHLPINVKEMKIDMLSMSGHKFNSPKGVGALYVRKGIILPNLIDGGSQERGRRAGTENAPGIVGMGVAIENAVKTMSEEAPRIARLREKLLCGLMERIPYCRRNTPETNTLPGIANLSVRFVEGESMLLMLDMKGICASSGSACTSGSLDPSHVMLAIGLDHGTAHGSIRFSLDRYNTEEEIDYILDVFPKIVERLRDMSPVWTEENRAKIK